MKSKAGTVVKNSTKKIVEAKQRNATAKEVAEYLLTDNTIDDAQALLKELGRKMSEDIPMTGREIELYHMTPEQVLDKLEEEKQEFEIYINSKGTSIELINAKLEYMAENPGKFMPAPLKYKRATKRELGKSLNKKKEGK